MGIFNKKKKRIEEDNSIRRFYSGRTGEKSERVRERQEKLLRMLAPDGINTKLLPYTIVNDAGQDIYYSTLYIDKLARRPVIASTFTRLFDFTGVTATVYVHPLLEESIKRVNKRIDMLDSEQEAAEHNRNRLREISGKIQNAEALARQLDSGEVSLYEVYFLFLVRADSAEHLRAIIMEMCTVARGENMELSACYAAHPEGLLSSMPFNKLYPVRYKPGIPGTMPFKKFIMDEASLSTIFSHTSAEFFHKNGALIGYTLNSAMPFTYDPFDKSHFSYGVIVCGMTGYGKSATVKQICTRLVDFDYYFASIDYEANGQRGEYAAACEAVGGVNYAIGSVTGDRVNLFEINEEIEIDEVTGRDYRVLRVNDKIVDLTNILMSIAMTSSVGDAQARAYDAGELDRMQEIIMRTVQSLYYSFGIIEADPDSLYEFGNDGTSFSSGRRRKRLPQMKDFYMALIRMSVSNQDPFKNNAYSLLIGKFYDRVGELYYCPECLKEFTAEEVAKLPRDASGAPYHKHDDRNIKLVYVKGASAYFDCQSTVRLDANAPWYNFDISRAPETERPVLILICQNFIHENFIKRNSVDPTKAKKLIFLIDEFHKIRQPQAIAFVASTYRTARKRRVSPWIITQSIADLNRYRESEEIVKQTETLMLLKHKTEDRNALKELAGLSESQIDAVLDLGGNDENNKRYGEMCMVDIATKKTTFVKVHYLERTEATLVETDTEKRAELMRKRRGM